jgi:hypothetical protein
MKLLKFLILFIALYNNLAIYLIIVDTRNSKNDVVVGDVCEEYTGNQNHSDNFYKGTIIGKRLVNGEDKVVEEEVKTSRNRLLCKQDIPTKRFEADRSLIDTGLDNCVIRTSQDNQLQLIFVHLIREEPWPGMQSLELNSKSNTKGLSLICVPKAVEEETNAYKKYDSDDKYTVELFLEILQQQINGENDHEERFPLLKQIGHGILSGISKLNPIRLVNYIDKKLERKTKKENKKENKKKEFAREIEVNEDTYKNSGKERATETKKVTKKNSKKLKRKKM